MAIGTSCRKTSVYGTVDELPSQVIRELQDVGCILQIYGEYCKLGNQASLGALRSGSGNSGTGEELKIIIYGPSEMFNTLGSWLSDRRLFLQDPLNCEMDVPYKNPHLLCEDEDDTVMTFELSQRLNLMSIERIDVRPDLFELLNEDRHLPQTEAPKAISTPLYRFL
jgi:hypothetical protein